MSHRKSVSIFSAIVLLLFSIVVPIHSTEASTFSELVAFGTSMTDSGNVAIASPAILGFSAPPSPPYYMGRFTNGPTWLDVLADKLGVERPMPSLSGGTNYAWGGATTGSIDNTSGVVDMDDQVATYLSERTPSGNELFVISGVAAANDFAEGQQDPVSASPINWSNSFRPSCCWCQQDTRDESL